MKTLYVSDLDGTLFNTKKRITPYTAAVINACVDKGAGFAVATARMPYGCDYRLEALHSTIPGIVTNGVFLYDFVHKKYLSTETIPAHAVKQALSVFAFFGIPCFLYLFADNAISIFYNNTSLMEQTQYYSDRAIAKCKSIRFSAQLESALQNGEAFYIAVTGKKEQLQPVCSQLDTVESVAYSFYLNIYNGLYCLEVYSKNASKKQALKKLCKLVNCEELVVFGDNLNDLSMIELSDRSYAPANALDSIKERVTAVIGDCDEDGVAHFLADEMQL